MLDKLRSRLVHAGPSLMSVPSTRPASLSATPTKTPSAATQ
ncbi:hypothetical protein MJM45_33070 [Salmonella enterica subsp. enterica serovar Kentucky]|nr:hypothetical protein [Salmonella enterica subsp. enterica serovar Kentucky]